jgi:hypothetical protein
MDVPVTVPDVAFGSGWNGSLAVPTRNSIWDARGAADGLCDLDGAGLVPISRLPALAITKSTVVASQAAQLALTAEEGDVAIRSDLNKTYIKNTGTAGTMADWSELLTPTDAVSSVAGLTGVITSAGLKTALTLVAGDVGLGNVTNESKATMFTSAALTGTPTAPTAATGTKTTQLATTAFVNTPGIQSAGSNTITPTFSDDIVQRGAVSAAPTFANPTGTAVDGWAILVRHKANGAYAISYGTQYRAIGVTLPTVTVNAKWMYFTMVYNSADTKWDVLAVGTEA